LIVSPGHGMNFGLSGTADRPLAPGVKAGIDVSITNPSHRKLRITSLTVTVTGTSTPGCATSNFTITQYTGTYPLIVPSNSTRTLTQLGVTAAHRPQITMLNLPVNQDICQNTGITLGLAGTGTGH